MRLVVLVLALAPQAALACGMSYRSEAVVVKKAPAVKEAAVAERAAEPAVVAPTLTTLLDDIDAALIPETPPAQAPTEAPKAPPPTPSS